MLPAERGEMGEQSIRDQIAAAMCGIQCTIEIDGLPQHDSCRDQGKTAGAMLLGLSGAVVQLSETMEANGTRQSIMAFALVQLRRGLSAELRLFQSVQSVKCPLDAPDLSEHQCQAVLSWIGAKAFEHQ